MAVLESACFNANSAITAWKAGADRIELCDNQDVGGTTPLMESLLAVKRHVSIPVFVMIRPRGGDFNYTDQEFEQMKADVETFKPVVDGFVLGILDANYENDVPRTSELVERARPLPCTFHRAFDETSDPLRAVEQVIATGCNAILSSGGAVNAVSGATTLRKLVHLVDGQITVIPGGGVRAKSLLDIHRIVQASVYHSSALANGSREPDPSEIKSMKLILSEDGSTQVAQVDSAGK